MRKTYKAKLVPMEKEGWSKNDILRLLDDPKGISLAEHDFKGVSIFYQAQRLVITDEAGKVIAAYHTMPDTHCIDLSDVRRWIDEGCKESVELEVIRRVENYKAGVTVPHSGLIPKTVIKDLEGKGYYKDAPTLNNNTVKMVWGEQKELNDLLLKGWNQVERARKIIENGIVPDKAQPIAGDVETEAKFRYQHFENDATRNHFELGFIDGANWREHHPATDWEALRDKLKELCKYKININDDGIDGIINFFKNELTK